MSSGPPKLTRTESFYGYDDDGLTAPKPPINIFPRRSDRTRPTLMPIPISPIIKQITEILTEKKKNVSNIYINQIDGALSDVKNVRDPTRTDIEHAIKNVDNYVSGIIPFIKKVVPSSTVPPPPPLQLQPLQLQPPIAYKKFILSSNSATAKAMYMNKTKKGGKFTKPRRNKRSTKKRNKRSNKKRNKRARL